ncbi:hypothetical protein VOLCADRAFT_121754 [Volvox carteri f. nagariensis]|uniref:Golgi to ER traffic protein 4 n=1 Tax=Volvox carteri f. nagariensis TaxID=3068 RepID=D8UJB4_VOLCA|nr:uncharacterized protein VOLCADRAFT_121754 [Volvox carteri f. nagariensis]EFJ40193.1 hypothetical protein VOLCADRAFT_121754 [Volvox carteri f. nagariensis]|eukprot:XP_002958737.1 hypothetical protein VOLCADRAFT_121754 [Volvox carteri f. nagariensis]
MPPSVEKTLARIRESVESGAYYEAQQMYKTSYHRSKARQQFADAVAILQEGAVTQLAHGQPTCGVELGMLLIEAYVAASTPADADTVSRVLAIIRAFPLTARTSADANQGQATSSSSSSQAVASPVVDEYARLVAAAVKWANKYGLMGGDPAAVGLNCEHASLLSSTRFTFTCVIGLRKDLGCRLAVALDDAFPLQSKNGAVVSARRIHSAFASYLWRSFGTDGIGRALPHFIRGEDAEEFAEALYSCARQGPSGEADLWLLRAVLQVLAAASGSSSTAQMSYARALYDAFIAKDSPLDTPTGHFTELVLLAVEHTPISPRAHDMFALVRERYSDGVLRRDESLGALMERVEGLFFNMRRGGSALGGLLGDLFRTLTEVQ